MARSTPPGPRRRRRQRGAVLVEIALTLPIFLLVVFAIVEFGFLLRDHVTLNASTSETARAATIVGDDITGDGHIVEVFRTAVAPLPDGAVEQLVVFKATGPDDVVPPSCLSASVTDLCNRYTWADLQRPTTDFGCIPANGLDHFWCPTDRDITQANADFIGIHVEMRRDLITGLFGDEQTMSATDVLRLEPQER